MRGSTIVYVGDVVIFATAGAPWNRTRRYVVTEVARDGITVWPENEAADPLGEGYEVPHANWERMGLTVVGHEGRV